MHFSYLIYISLYFFIVLRCPVYYSLLFVLISYRFLFSPSRYLLHVFLLNHHIPSRMFILFSIYLHVSYTLDSTLILLIYHFLLIQYQFIIIIINYLIIFLQINLIYFLIMIIYLLN